MQTLLDLGASPNYKDTKGLTPLYHCILNTNSSPQCTQMLLHDRAEIEQKDSAGWTELHQVSLLHLLYIAGVPFVLKFLKFLKFHNCPEIVLKSAIVLKFYSFGSECPEIDLCYTVVTPLLLFCTLSLSYMVKAALTLSHSDAIPERGFSVNNALQGKEKLALAENTIVAQHVVKDCVQIFGSVINVPITKDVITAARRAHVEYCAHLDEQKRQQAAELQRRAELEKQQEDKIQPQKQKASLMEQLPEKGQEEQDQKCEHDTAKELINKATNKMTAAVELKDMQSVQVAQMMLKAGNEKLQETAKKLDMIDAKQRDLRKRLHDHDMKDVPPANEIKT